MNTALVTLRALSALFTSCVYHVAKLGNDLDTGVYKMFSGLCTKEYFAVVGLRTDTTSIPNRCVCVCVHTCVCAYVHAKCLQCG